MFKKTAIAIILTLCLFTIGCQTWEGVKGDATYIGDKTTEIIDECQGQN